MAINALDRRVIDLIVKVWRSESLKSVVLTCCEHDVYITLLF
jgi:hypothetical protein